MQVQVQVRVPRDHTPPHKVRGLWTHVSPALSACSRVCCAPPCDGPPHSGLKPARTPHRLLPTPALVCGLPRVRGTSQSKPLPCQPPLPDPPVDACRPASLPQTKQGQFVISCRLVVEPLPKNLHGSRKRERHQGGHVSTTSATVRMSPSANVLLSSNGSARPTSHAAKGASGLQPTLQQSPELISFILSCQICTPP